MQEIQHQSLHVNHYGFTIHHEYDARDLRLISQDDTQADHRHQIKWDVSLHPKHGHPDITIAPLWCANIHFATLRLAKFLTDWPVTNAANPDSRVQIALHKEIPEKELGDFFIQHGTASAWMSIGINGKNQKELEKLRNIFKRVSNESEHGLNKIVIDASNGHMNAMRRRIAAVREIVDDKAIILAGNVVTGQMTQKLLEDGADGVKLNHGPAKVCRTRQNSGIYRPTFTTAAECSLAAHEMGGFTVSDGGGTSLGGTSAVLFTGGVDGIMSGSLFAGHKECDEPFFRNINPLDRKDVDFFKRYMWYFGSASIDALNKYHGGRDSHRPSEGTRRKVPYKEDLKETLEQWFSSVASTVSFRSDQLSKESQSSEESPPTWTFYDLRNSTDRLVYAPM